MKRCANCGYKMKSGLNVCTECGARQNIDEHSKKKATQKIRKVPRKKKPIRRPEESRFIKKLWLSAAAVFVLLVALGVSYYLLDKKYSPNQLLDAVAVTVRAENSAGLAEIIGKGMTESEADAYLKYIDSSMGREKFAAELVQLDNNNPKVTDSGFDLIELSKKQKLFLFFQQYEVNIPEHKVTVVSDIEDGQFMYQAGNQELKWSTSRETFDEMIPGIYNFEGILTVDGIEFDSNLTVDFTDADTENVKGNLLLDGFYTEVIMEKPAPGLYLNDMIFSVNDKEINLDFDEPESALYGPLKYETDYHFALDIMYIDKEYRADEVKINIPASDELSSSRHIVPLKFNQDIITAQINSDKAEEEAARAERQQREKEDAENERKAASSINISIDVFSDEFINDYFSGPEPYKFEGLTIGMSETEIEDILGEPEEYYEVEGGAYAIYGNAAILYSESFPSKAYGGSFKDIDPDTNYVERVEVLLKAPHSEVVRAYGEPTLRYDEYPDIGPGGRRTIYDGKRNNGYAVYIDVGLSGTTWLMVKDEESDLVEDY